MIKYIDVLEIKNKFATLISKLYTDAKIDVESINEKLIDSNFLDGFEKNDISNILDSSYQTIIYQLYKKEIVFQEPLNIQLYWCGKQYINIFLNERIPIKQILLVLPIQEMIKLFEVYHEINEKELISFFDKKYENTSILKLLRERKNYTIKQLSLLTDISENTIKYYEKNNNNLFNGSFKNIHQLKEVLDIDESLFIEKTNFNIYTSTVINDPQMFSDIVDFTNEYYGNKYKIDTVDNTLVLVKGKKKGVVEGKVVKKAVETAIDNYHDDKLLF